MHRKLGSLLMWYSKNTLILPPKIVQQWHPTPSENEEKGFYYYLPEIRINKQWQNKN
jgi:hypothetical protein